jgi:hypothetical protein
LLAEVVMKWLAISQLNYQHDSTGLSHFAALRQDER